MKQAFIYLTLRCNNKCKMCYMSNHYSKKEEMEYTEACNLLDELKKQEVQKVTFLGGEPTMYTKLRELLIYAKSIGIPFVRLQTNGQFDTTFFDEDVIQECVDAFTFSLDGHTEELNKKMRIGSDFNRVVTNIKKALTYDKKIAVNTTISNVNIDYIYDIINFIESLKVPNLYLNIMFDTNGELITDDEADLLVKKWKEVCVNITKIYAESSLRIKMPIGYSEKVEEDNVCLAMNPDRVYIMPNLDWYTCILFVNDPLYAIQPYSWERPNIMQAFSESKCNEACFFLKEKYRNTFPMCLYFKKNIGQGT